MRRISLSYLVIALGLFSAAGVHASDATTAQLVMAANAAATQDGGKASIASLFSTKFATGLSQGQTVSVSLLQGANFGDALAPNTFLSIFLSPPGLVPLETGSFEVWDQFFEMGVECPDAVPRCLAPTDLLGVRVTVNDKPGFPSAVVSGADFDQINFISPGTEDIGMGAGMTVKVFKGPDASEASGTASVQFDDIAPGFFPFNPEGRRFLAAAQNTPDPDTPCTFVGREDLFGGAPLPNGCTIRPAKPGDIIALFGTGFGKTDPEVPVAVGQIATVVATLVDQVNVTFGGQQTRVFFGGLAFGLAGVFQIVIEVPDLPDGDHELIAEVNGRSTQLEAFITVQREQ